MNINFHTLFLPHSNLYKWDQSKKSICPTSLISRLHPFTLGLPKTDYLFNIRCTFDTLNTERMT